MPTITVNVTDTSTGGPASDPHVVSGIGPHLVSLPDGMVFDKVFINRDGDDISLDVEVKEG